MGSMFLSKTQKWTPSYEGKRESPCQRVSPMFTPCEELFVALGTEHLGSSLPLSPIAQAQALVCVSICVSMCACGRRVQNATLGILLSWSRPTLPSFCLR